MRKRLLAFFIAIIMICTLCTACGNSTASVEGSWYSVVDTTMYNFGGGEITVSGVVVGQYEDNGDSVVVSFIDDGVNLKLYVTKMDGIDVLADVKEGDGNIYFCKELENAQAIIKQQEAELEAKLQEFTDYFSDNLFGVWVTDREDAHYTQVEFLNDGTVERTLHSGEIEVDKLVTNSEGLVRYDIEMKSYVSKDGNYDSPTITIYLSADGTMKDADDLNIWAVDNTYTDNCLGMYAARYTKQN